MKKQMLVALIRECIREVLAESEKSAKQNTSAAIKKTPSVLKPEKSSKSALKPTADAPEDPLKQPTKPPRAGYKWVRSIMNGAWVEEPKDLPFTLSVASETYWSS